MDGVERFGSSFLWLLPVTLGDECEKGLMVVGYGLSLLLMQEVESVGYR